MNPHYPHPGSSAYRAGLPHGAGYSHTTAPPGSAGVPHDVRRPHSGSRLHGADFPHLYPPSFPHGASHLHAAGYPYGAGHPHAAGPSHGGGASHDTRLPHGAGPPHRQSPSHVTARRGGKRKHGGGHMEVSVEASPSQEYTIPGQGHTAQHSYGGYGNAGPESVGDSSLPDSDFLDGAAVRQIAMHVFEERNPVNTARMDEIKKEIKNEIKNEIKDEIKQELTMVNGRLTKVETDTAGLKAEQTKAIETQGYLKGDIQAKDKDCRRRFQSVLDRNKETHDEIKKLYKAVTDRQPHSDLRGQSGQVPSSSIRMGVPTGQLAEQQTQLRDPNTHLVGSESGQFGQSGTSFDYVNFEELSKME